MEGSTEKRFFKPAGASSFKLIAPPTPGDRRFKPASEVEIGLIMPREPGPAGRGKVEILDVVTATVGSQEAPTSIPVPVKAVTARQEDDSKILARMEHLLKIDKRVNDLEEENDLLLQMVNRLKAENVALKAK